MQVSAIYQVFQCDILSLKAANAIIAMAAYDSLRTRFQAVELRDYSLAIDAYTIYANALIAYRK